MEPKLPAPNPSPEMGGYGQQELPKPIEVKAIPQSDKKPEKAESHEASQGPAQGAPVLPVPQAITPPTPKDTAKKPQAIPTSDDLPLTAEDEDVIAKEWVNKAKTIVNQTRNDPYQQEKEVSKLQASYLKTRYGKEIKSSE